MAKSSDRRKANPSTPGLSAQRPVSPALFWASMTITTLCVIVITWLVVGNIPVSDFGIAPRILVLALLLIFVVASLGVTEVIPWRSRNWTEWRRPKVLSNVVYLLLAGASFIAGISTVFSPPLATEATLTQTKERVEAVGEVTNKIGEVVGIGRESRIRQHIAGIWGEEGCAVTYRLSLNDRSLSMASVLNAGMQPENEQYTITEDSDRFGPNGERLSVMETRGERGLFRGFGVTFTYATNGATETLRWQPRKPEVNSTTFVRCEAE